MIKLKFEKNIDSEVWGGRFTPNSLTTEYAAAIKSMQIGDSFEVKTKKYQLSSTIHQVFKYNGMRGKMRTKKRPPGQFGYKTGWTFRLWRIA